MGTEGGRSARKPQQRDENRIETTLVYEILLAIPDLIVYMVLWPIHEKDFVWRLVTTIYSYNCRGRNSLDSSTSKNAWENIIASLFIP